MTIISPPLPCPTAYQAERRGSQGVVLIRLLANKGNIMHNLNFQGMIIAIVVFTSISCTLSSNVEQKSKINTGSLEDVMTVKGEFEVSLMPQSDGDFEAGRTTIDKKYFGDLKGIGKGQMLNVRTSVQGSAGYVAIEHVTGTLNGRLGSFTLQHSGIMNRGASKLAISVVPDSGTGELSGLSGEMNIIISEGKHYYEFTYTLSSGE